MDGNIIIQEKIDGSQLSFGMNENGELEVHSHHSQIFLENPAKLFRKAVTSLLEIKDKLMPGVVYRGEYVSKPNHNVLTYDRTPKNFIVLFDVESSIVKKFLSPSEVSIEARRIGLESVPCFYQGNGKLISIQNIQEFIDTKTSLLGGKIEGVVVKNYDLLNDDGNPTIGKFVSAGFKEVAQHDNSKPATKDIIEQLSLLYRTEARWDKGIQHLGEQGKLEGSPKDIGLLVREIQKDIEDEEMVNIKELLWKWAKPKVMNSVLSGFPEYYKKYLKRLEEDKQMLMSGHLGSYWAPLQIVYSDIPEVSDEEHDKLMLLALHAVE